MRNRTETADLDVQRIEIAYSNPKNGTAAGSEIYFELKLFPSRYLYSYLKEFCLLK
jgi:hypothetical protein